MHLLLKAICTNALHTKFEKRADGADVVNAAQRLLHTMFTETEPAYEPEEDELEDGLVVPPASPRAVTKSFSVSSPCVACSRETIAASCQISASPLRLSARAISLYKNPSVAPVTARNRTR